MREKKGPGAAPERSRKPLTPERAAVRAHEIQPSLAGRSGAVVNVNFKATRVVGAAAQICVLIKDQEVIADYAGLEAAAGEIGVDDILLGHAMKHLEAVGYVRLKTSGKGQITRVQVSIPLLSSSYEGLGQIWTDLEPSAFEQQSLAILDDTCVTPITADTISERHDVVGENLDLIVEIGEQIGYFGQFTHTGSKRSIIYSPLHFDEHPRKLIELAELQDPDVLVDSLKRAREQQGLPAEHLDAGFVSDAIAVGALYIPSVESMAGEKRFVFAPIRAYSPEQKIVLEKARAILACVRYGQHYGTITKIRDPMALLNALKVRGRLTPHSESIFQYRVLRDLGIADIRKSPFLGRFEIVVRKSPENLRAIDLAIELAALGELTPTSSKVTKATAALADGVYKSAIAVRGELAQSRKIRYSPKLAEHVNSLILGLPEDLI